MNKKDDQSYYEIAKNSADHILLITFYRFVISITNSFPSSLARKIEPFSFLPNFPFDIFPSPFHQDQSDDILSFVSLKIILEADTFEHDRL
jgi:hypothetical protein